MVTFVFFLPSTNFTISFFVKGHGTFTIYLKKEEKQDITTYLLWSLEQNNTHSTIISMHKRGLGRARVGINFPGGLDRLYISIRTSVLFSDHPDSGEARASSAPIPSL